MVSGAQTVISCDVTGLLAVLDSVAWEKSTGDPITAEMTDYEVAAGAYNAGTKIQKTTLTVKNGINTADAEYKCAVTRNGQTRKTSVHLNIFSKSNRQHIKFTWKNINGVSGATRPGQPLIHSTI